MQTGSVLLLRGLQRAELQGFSQLCLGWSCKAFWSSRLDPSGCVLSPCCSSGSSVPVVLAQLGMLRPGLAQLDLPLKVSWKVPDEGCHVNWACVTSVCPAPAHPTLFKHIYFALRMDYHLTKTQFETQYFSISKRKKETSCIFSAFLLQREKTRAIP